jgi:phosphoserine phosphatase
MRLIITRHGETEENKLNIMQGHRPGKLSKEGIEQARKVALRLAKEKIDVIYSSDLARAADTAREIARYHPFASLIFTEEMRERNFGVYEGMSRDDFKIEDFALTLEPEHGETYQMHFDRVDTFLKGVIKKHMNETILLVGHGGTNKMLLGSIENATLREIHKKDPQKNTAVSVIEIDGKRHMIHLLNDTTHLD